MSGLVDFSKVRVCDNLHWFHPWEELATPGRHDRSIAAGGRGIYVTDETGRRLIDGPGGMWCVQIGYGSSAMATAIADQVLRMPYMSPYTLTCETSSLLARKLAETSSQRTLLEGIKERFDLPRVPRRSGANVAQRCGLARVTNIIPSVTRLPPRLMRRMWSTALRPGLATGLPFSRMKRLQASRVSAFEIA